jgi:4-amino-4-deoxy-L-arabinose transferase-like glycosyltransferase
MKPQNLLALVVAAIGGVCIAVAVARMFLGRRPHASTPERECAAPMVENDTAPRAERDAWRITGPLGATLLLAILVGGAVARVDDLGGRSISHVEVYVPGIPLPEEISEPPPRQTVRRLVLWHFHQEPHPQGYYFLMYPWTRLFGTSPFALRFPSVLFGTGCILLVAMLGARLYGPRIGLLAAALLAFNGMQIFWSQQARMYALTCFLGLLSTLILAAMLRRRARSPALEIGYIAASWMGVFTEMIYWPLLLGQMLWTFVEADSSGQRARRIIRIQSLVVILGAPMWAHAVYLTRHSPLARPNFSFLRDYLSFGFVLTPDNWGDLFPDPPLVLTLPLLIVALILLVRGLASVPRPAGAEWQCDPGPARGLLPAAAGAVLLIVAMAVVAKSRTVLMLLTAILPITVLAAPALLERFGPIVRRRTENAGARGAYSADLRTSVLWLGLFPAAISVAVSFLNPVTSSRTFLIFAPYLLIGISAGAVRLMRSRTSRVLVLGTLVLIHAASVVRFAGATNTPRDYQGLARKVAERYQADDLIFVRNRNWADTPLFYYLDDGRYRFVAEDYAGAVARAPGSRVWVIHFGIQAPTDEMLAALEAHVLDDRLESSRALALLYVPSAFGREGDR